jgi:hypothetical protein
LKCGFPERLAQQAWGPNSKAVHRAYAKYAEVTAPSLDDWEKDWREKPQRGAQPKLQAGDYRLPPSAIAQANQMKSSLTVNEGTPHLTRNAAKEWISMPRTALCSPTRIGRL